MTTNALYTDLSGYYDLMCADIDYTSQSNCVRRLHQIFGNDRASHLDLACGTGPHVQHFADFGFQSSGLDINQPMLDIARQRCPNAAFSLQDMCNFGVDKPLDLITCFLYSIHYSGSIDQLKACIASVHRALNTGGVFCFNSVDKHKIDTTSFVRHTAEQDGSHFSFSSGWRYDGQGDKQSLRLKIERTTNNIMQVWQDEHPMVAISFNELKVLLEPYFEVHIFEHDYDKLIPWDTTSGNAIFCCVKI